MTTTITHVLGAASFPAFDENVRDIRNWVESALLGYPEGLIDDAVLCTSELAANSVRHSRSGRRPVDTIQVVLLPAEDGAVRVEVTDAGSRRGRPHRRSAGPDGEGGRGLELVAAFSNDHWGVDIDRATRRCTVHFVIASP